MLLEAPVSLMAGPVTWRAAIGVVVPMPTLPLNVPVPNVALRDESIAVVSFTIREFVQTCAQF